MIKDGFEQANGSKVTVLGLTYLEIDKLKEPNQVLVIDPKPLGNNDHVIIFTGLTQESVSDKYKEFLKNIKKRSEKMKESED